MINHGCFNNLEADVLLMEDQGGGVRRWSICQTFGKHFFGWLSPETIRNPWIICQHGSSCPQIGQLERLRWKCGIPVLHVWLVPKQRHWGCNLKLVFFPHQFGRILSNGFLNFCFLLIIGRIDISFHMYKLQVVEVKGMMCQLVQIKVSPSVSARI